VPIPEVIGFRLCSWTRRLSCSIQYVTGCEYCAEYGTDGRRCAVNVADDQKHGGPHEADQAENALHASPPQHGEDRDGCSQAEHHHRIPAADGLYDLAPQLGT
jgi:hypothetical protein